MIYYLEMAEPPHSPPSNGGGGLEIAEVTSPNPLLNAQLYREVGGPWSWTDRLVWSEEEWARHTSSPDIHTFIATLAGEMIGYAEMDASESGEVEIVYFGLLPEFIGKKLGKPFLTLAIAEAWKIPNTARVWLHTCTKDHPSALRNYLDGGFSLYQTLEG